TRAVCAATFRGKLERRHPYAERRMRTALSFWGADRQRQCRLRRPSGGTGLIQRRRLGECLIGRPAGRRSGPSAECPMRSRLATRAGLTIAEAAGSHAIYISKPEVVATLIAKAKNVSSQMAA